MIGPETSSSNIHKPSLFPNMFGAERRVPADGYEVLGGDEEPLVINLDRLSIRGSKYPTKYSGINDIGSYYEEDGLKRDVLSFLYHKLDASGQLETTERVIIWTGTGYGVHPGHTGQEPSWYLVGPQLGTINPETGETQGFPDNDIEIPVKHFSIACITGGPLGEPILANPS